METFSALLAICAGNSPGTGEFPAKRPVTQSFDVSFDLRRNKWLNKQSWGWWFETLLRPLWRQCNAHVRQQPVYKCAIPQQLMVWRRKGLRHQQQWCWPISPESSSLVFWYQKLSFKILDFHCVHKCIAAAYGLLYTCPLYCYTDLTWTHRRLYALGITELHCVMDELQCIGVIIGNSRQFSEAFGRPLHSPN